MKVAIDLTPEQISIPMHQVCQVCSTRELRPIIDMGHHPPSDRFLTTDQLNREEIHYPLKVAICDECKLVQLTSTVDPNILFTDKFVYRTGHNQTLRTHFKQLVRELVRHLGLGEDDFVLDIGSNDGTLLSYYPDEVRLLGVDPSKAAQIAVERGIPTRQTFFSDDLASEIAREHGRARVITCTNTFAHIPDLDSLMGGIKRLLQDKGVFVQESHYLLNLVRELQYDEIYQEHLRYYSLESLVNLFEQYDMEVIDAERVPTHGGSIKTVAARPGVHDVDESVNRLLNEERGVGLNEYSRLKKFARAVQDNRLELLDLLTDLRGEGHRIVGVGAAAKGVSRLNYCRIGPELIDYIAETNEFKIGKYTPGTHIPIIDEEEMLADDPAYALLLAWNLEDVIVPNLRENGFDGDIILPNPAGTVTT